MMYIIMSKEVQKHCWACDWAVSQSQPWERVWLGEHSEDEGSGNNCVIKSSSPQETMRDKIYTPLTVENAVDARWETLHAQHD